MRCAYLEGKRVDAVELYKTIPIVELRVMPFKSHKGEPVIFHSSCYHGDTYISPHFASEADLNSSTGRQIDSRVGGEGSKHSFMKRVISRRLMQDNSFLTEVHEEYSPKWLLDGVSALRESGQSLKIRIRPDLYFSGDDPAYSLAVECVSDGNTDLADNLEKETIYQNLKLRTLWVAYMDTERLGLLYSGNIVKVPKKHLDLQKRCLGRVYCVSEDENLLSVHYDRKGEYKNYSECTAKIRVIQNTYFELRSYDRYTSPRGPANIVIFKEDPPSWWARENKVY